MMTDEELAKIRASIEYRRQTHELVHGPEDSPWHRLVTQCAALLAEVERLRAQNASLRAQNAALREIVAFVAGEPYYTWSESVTENLELSEVMQDKARTLLAGEER